MRFVRYCHESIIMERSFFEKNIVVYILILIVVLSSCNYSNKYILNEYDSIFLNNNTNNQYSSVVFNDILFDDDHVKTSMRPMAGYVYVHNGLFIYEDHGSLYEVNFETGKLVGMCHDPLCQHKIATCVNKYIIYHAIGFNERIYIYGLRNKIIGEKLTHEEFVGYFDVEKDKYIIADIYYIDINKCIIRIYGVFNDHKYDGIYLIDKYNTDNKSYYQLMCEE